MVSWRGMKPQRGSGAWVVVGQMVPGTLEYEMARLRYQAGLFGEPVSQYLHRQMDAVEARWVQMTEAAIRRYFLS